MATKTFRIGERCAGGIIQVNIKGDEVTASFLDYNTKKPLPFGTRTVNVTYKHSERNLREFFDDNTTSYHADKVMEWIKSKIKFASDNTSWL